MFNKYYCYVYNYSINDQGSDMMNKGQESEMRSIKETFTKENSLQLHQQKSASTLSMEFVGHSA